MKIIRAQIVRCVDYKKQDFSRENKSKNYIDVYWDVLYDEGMERVPLTF